MYNFPQWFDFENIFEFYDWKSDEKVNYLLYTYEPEEGSKLGTAYTDNFLCEFAEANSVHYALKYTKSGHKFDVFGCIETLKKYEKPLCQQWYISTSPQKLF